nr:unnamed protein product [Digitaria exilis]
MLSLLCKAERKWPGLEEGRLEHEALCLSDDGQQQQAGTGAGVGCGVVEVGNRGHEAVRPLHGGEEAARGRCARCGTGEEEDVGDEEDKQPARGRVGRCGGEAAGGAREARRGHGESTNVGREAIRASAD